MAEGLSDPFAGIQTSRKLGWRKDSYNKELVKNLTCKNEIYKFTKG
jgi:hypothetical protein